ncbi:hypothetical protein GCM10027074_75590 [Streptomyces deserti]
MTDAGWRKRAGDIYSLELGNGFHARLGLNRASKHVPLKINPVVGLRYHPVEQLVAELLGEPMGFSATIARPVGYLTPSRSFLQLQLQLQVAAEADAEPVAEELVALVNDYGLPFARRHADPDALAAMIVAGGNVPNPDRARLLLPALQFLQGRKEEARASVAVGLDHFPDSCAGPASAEYHRFAAGFTARAGRASELS